MVIRLDSCEILITCANHGDGGFMCILEPKQSLILKIFNSGKYINSLDSVRNILDNILRLDREIADVKWNTLN